jgi:hypothetical protein
LKFTGKSAKIQQICKFNFQEENLVKYKSFILLLIFLMPALLCAQASKKIIASGEGTSEAQALDQAKRSAVEQGIGSVVSAETITRNFQLANDRILSRANGFVKNYVLLAKNTTPSGIVVKIEAEVTEIFDELLKDQMAIDLLLQWMEKPRFMLLVAENNLGETTSACETELARKLTEKHFDLVSSAQTKALREKKEAQSALSGDVNAAAAFALDSGAEMLVIGRAFSTEGSGVKALEESGLKSVQADFSAQIVGASDARILASYTAHNAAVHISPASAGIMALTKASDSMADSLVAFLLKRGGEAQVNARSYTLNINGVGFKELNALKSALTSVSGVSAVYQRSFHAPVAELAVDFYGNAMDLASALDGLAVEGKKLRVSEVTPSAITLNLTQ